MTQNQRAYKHKTSVFSFREGIEQINGSRFTLFYKQTLGKR